MTRALSVTAAALAALLLLASCRDPTGPSLAADEGWIEFEHTFASRQPFLARGSVYEPDPLTGHASGRIRTPYPGIAPLYVVVGVTPRGVAARNGVTIHLNGGTPGTYEVGTPACAGDPPSGTRCAAVFLDWGDWSGQGNWTRLAAGEVVVTRSGHGRLRGTFHGVSGADLSFSVSNGRFDVPLAPDP
jgi:hypothetical protein